MQPWLTLAAVLLLGVGLPWGLFVAPADWLQGDAARILFVHVPSAWLASAAYVALPSCGIASLV